MISFQLRPVDIDSYHKHYMRKHGTFIQRYLHWIVLSFFVAFVVFTFIEKQASVESYLMVAPIIFLMVLLQNVFTTYLRRKAITAYLKKNPAMIGNRAMYFKATELVVTIDGKDMSYKYSDFKNLESNKTHYFAFVNEQNAVIIPKRIFKNEEELKSSMKKIQDTIK